MTKEKVIPQIRFSGFTDTWEQRKLSAIADKVTEKNVGLQYIETFTNSAEFGIISQRDFFDHDIAKMSSLGGYYIVRSEDFVYNPRISTSAPVGPINRNKLGRIGVMSPLYTVFRPHDIDTTYLEYFFKSKYWHSFMNFNGDSGARSDRFSIKDSVFFEMPIPIPHIDEQKKIGAFLDKLDSLITLHQRKYDKLTKVKKAMLEKMFPENGSPYPEIRFKGFTDAWEQRKLGDIASDMVAGGDIDKDLILAEGQYPVIANALTGDGIVGYYDKEYRVNAPAVTVTGRGDVGHAKARLVNFTPVVRLLSVKSEHDVFFLENVINTLKIVIESTGVPQLTVPQLAKYEVAFPRQLDEEEHIGAFFKQLDHLITLHQRKLEKVIFAFISL
ncbi:Type I restriction enzyme specificity protein MPN_089 [uncultured Ruminococcus sp.]|nr:Type I restriction enzyme specificity protein MPN_089 [uncultured Ruminococcus sp.]